MPGNIKNLFNVVNIHINNIVVVFKYPFPFQFNQYMNVNIPDAAFNGFFEINTTTKELHLGSASVYLYHQGFNNLFICNMLKSG